jgi:hypothetical protein
MEDDSSWTLVSTFPRVLCLVLVDETNLERMGMVGGRWGTW